MSDVLLGKPCAQQIYDEILTKLSALPVIPKLYTVGFADKSWQQYTNSLAKTAATCGIIVEHITVDNSTTPQEFSILLSKLSLDGQIGGILLQQPLPKAYANVADVILPTKDVDCLTSANVTSLYLGREGTKPATPLAVVKLLDYYNVDLCGKRVVIVGRGNAVGKPLSLIALSRNATITVCHTKTVGLAQICKQADILVSACGVAGLITSDFVNADTIVVDVGLSFVDGKTRGDVAPEVFECCKAVTPVPGGVGPVTRAVLLNNFVDLVLGNR